MPSNYHQSADGKFPTQFNVANVLIYGSPFFCFAWTGSLWKFFAVITVSIGIVRSPGIVARLFGVVFLLALLIWGAHAKLHKDDLPGSPEFLAFWAINFVCRWHGDGLKAAKDATSSPEWE